MAQYRKEVLNVAPGLGMAVADPRVAEEDARQARILQRLGLDLQSQSMAADRRSADLRAGLAAAATGGQLALARDQAGLGLDRRGGGSALEDALRAAIGGSATPGGRSGGRETDTPYFYGGAAPPGVGTPGRPARTGVSVFRGGRRVDGGGLGMTLEDLATPPPAGTGVFQATTADSAEALAAALERRMGEEDVLRRPPVAGTTLEQQRQAALDEVLRTTEPSQRLALLTGEDARQRALAEEERQRAEEERQRAERENMRWTGTGVPTSDEAFSRALRFLDPAPLFAAVEGREERRETRAENERLRRQDLLNRAREQLKLIDPGLAGLYGTGAIPQQLPALLAQLAATEPELAQAVVSLIDVPEVRQRVRGNVNTWLRPSGQGGLLGQDFANILAGTLRTFTGLETEEQAGARNVAELEAALARAVGGAPSRRETDLRLRGMPEFEREREGIHSAPTVEDLREAQRILQMPLTMREIQLGQRYPSLVELAQALRR